MGGCTFALNASLDTYHKGPRYSVDTHGDMSVSLAAEVGSYDRSILITGPDIYWRVTEGAVGPSGNDYSSHMPFSPQLFGGQGITTISMPEQSSYRTESEYYYMRMAYHRIENCGRVIMGQYCHHFHLMYECSKCKFEGIAVNTSVSKAFNVHSTSHARVEKYDSQPPRSGHLH